MRLDRYLAEQYTEYSRSTWQKFIERGYVFINGQIAISTKASIDDDDVVKFDVPEPIDFSKHTIPVLYEDDNIIVLDKPAGILTHAKGALNEEFSVAEFVRSKTGYHADTNRPGIIHRLDRDTSGVILCVKNEETAKFIQKQFQNRTVKKIYCALLQGTPRENEALIDVPIGRNPSKPSQFKADPNGKSAQTNYRVEKTDGHITLVRLEPKTGRTHQLRVHMQYIGTPIIGDRVYGHEADRLFLHAAELEVTLPGGVRKRFFSSIPDEFSL